MTTKKPFDRKLRKLRQRILANLEDDAKSLVAESYGFIDSGKYFEGAQTLTVKLSQPRMRNSRMIRI